MKKIITKSNFEKLGAEWTALDNKYDDLFQDFLDTPKIKTPKEISEFKQMQQRLYAIEDELYEIAQGKVEIKDT